MEVDFSKATNYNFGLIPKIKKYFNGKVYILSFYKFCIHFDFRKNLLDAFLTEQEQEELTIKQQSKK